MKQKNVNISFLFEKQDSLVYVLLSFFLALLPFTALLPHGRLSLLCLLPLLLGGAALVISPRPPYAPPPIYETKREKRNRHRLVLSDLFYFLYLSAVSSGFVLPSSPLPALAATFLSFYRFVPRVYPRFRFFPLLLGGAATALTAVFEYLLGKGSIAFVDKDRFGAMARAGGILGNPNTLAAFLLPLFFLALWEGDAERGSAKLPYFLLCFLLLSGILVSFSRGAWVVLFILLLLFFIYKFGFFRTFATCLALLPLLSLFVPQAIWQRFFSLFSPDSSVGYRFSLWKSIFRLPLSVFLFGVGEGKEALLTSLASYMAAGLEHVEHTHSLYLHLLTANGLFGAAFFFLSLFLGMRAKKKGVRWAIFSLLLFGLCDDPLYSGQNEVLFWLLTGML